MNRNRTFQNKSPIGSYAKPSHACIASASRMTTSSSGFAGRDDRVCVCERSAADPVCSVCIASGADREADYPALRNSIRPTAFLQAIFAMAGPARAMCCYESARVKNANCCGGCPSQNDDPAERDEGARETPPPFPHAILHPSAKFIPSGAEGLRAGSWREYYGRLPGHEIPNVFKDDCSGAFPNAGVL